MDYQITALTVKEFWVFGKVNQCTFQAKVYDKPSRFKYGINNGRVSKLSAQDKVTKDVLFDYDRGWNKIPGTTEDKELLNALLLFLEDLPDHRVWQFSFRRPKRFLVTDGEVLDFEDQ